MLLLKPYPLLFLNVYVHRPLRISLLSTVKIAFLETQYIHIYYKFTVAELQIRESSSITTN